MPSLSLNTSITLENSATPTLDGAWAHATITEGLSSQPHPGQSGMNMIRGKSFSQRRTILCTVFPTVYLKHSCLSSLAQPWSRTQVPFL